MHKKILLMVAISLVLTSIWFGPRKMLAHAEEGLPFYNLSRTYTYYSTVWHEIDLGTVNPFDISRIVYFRLLSGLNSVIKSGIDTQQIIFFGLILVPLICIPRLTQILVPNSSSSVGYTASLMYLFNLFVLSQVLQRFIYPLIFLWSFLPLFLFLWLKWLHTCDKKYLFYFIFSNLIYSVVYGLTSSVFALWIPAVILWLGNRKIVPAIVAVFFWFVSSIWWWLPILSIKDNPYKSFLNQTMNITSLVDVSKYYPNSESILLKQTYYFGPKSLLFNFYSSRIVSSMSLLLLGLLVIGILSVLKNKRSVIVVFILVIGWLFIKGANPPFGKEFYTWLFNTFPFTMVLRNPYEKLGVIFLLPYSLLVALGISKLPFRIFRSLVVFSICFILLRPMVTGQVFAGYQVSVPSSYQLANSFLNTKSNLRLFHLPFLQGAGSGYSWGYAGEEPSSYLFDRPSVSGTYFSPSDPYLSIYKYLRAPDFYRLMQFLSIDTIILHKDALPGPAYQEDYAGAKSMISQMKYVSLAKSYPDFDIYQLNPDLPVAWGYLSNYVISVPSLPAGFEKVVNDDTFHLLTDSFTTSPDIPGNFSETLPKYSLVKLSPVHYRIDVTSATGPYVAILQVNFNQSWTARVGKQVISNHFHINGFANGWYVDRNGDYSIDIIFKTWPWE